jgi:hypothetical protein
VPTFLLQGIKKAVAWRSEHISRQRTNIEQFVIIWRDGMETKKDFLSVDQLHSSDEIYEQ